jgi:hypothetical protein
MSLSIFGREIVLKRKIQYGLSILPLTLIAFGVTTITGPNAAAGATTPTPTAVEQHEMSVRAAFGLNTQLPYLRQVDAATKQNTISDVIGIPVTPVEEKNLEHREVVGAVIPQISNLESNSATYAGAWINQATGGVVHIAFTTPPSSPIIAKLRSLFPPDSAIQIDTAPVSLSRLLTLENSLATDTATLRKSGILVESTALNESTDTEPISSWSGCVGGQDLSLITGG